MRNSIRTAARFAGAAVVAGGIAAGGAAVGTGTAAADGFPGGPYCNGPAKVLAESAWSQVVICQIPDHSIDYMYQGKAKTTGDMTTLMTAQYASGGYHVSNNGYTYHVRPDALEIDGPDGGVVSYEPWTFYESTE